MADVAVAHARPSRGRVVVAWIVSVCAAVIVDGLALLGATQIVEFRVSHSTPVASPGGSASSPPPPRPTSTAVVPERDSRVPNECSGLYSAAMVGTLIDAGLRLQLEATPADIVDSGSGDQTLRELMLQRPLIECVWLDSAGGKQSGVLTVVAEATPQLAAAVEQRASQLGLTRLSENGGQRWVTEGTDADGTKTGESHFLRDGLWFATRWYGQGPYGYTSDMVKRVFA
ncbi:hypothetical protein EYE40_00940 [Glaciihabitans arcticus]|uniref:Uncharacterized protein n=1 Tax=Glaciihabitans arcticus TaxID=2668039 RepID=A0A4Q9GN53_9MICO|nr:hypothetical protein [Glaciihabitans arcticus]TBN56075.1 hypothetical protein EYE40_00940 [Glaciihabitans arcticus]